MKLEKDFLKKSLANIITSAALLIGGLTFSGCQSSQSSYSTLENEVYSYCSKFSRKIPKELVNKGECYHDSGLEIEDCESGFDRAKGKGRFVARQKLFGEEYAAALLASYIDANEFSVASRIGGTFFDPNELKSNIIFMRIELGFNELNKKVKEKKELTEEEKDFLDEIKGNVPYDDIIVLNKGKNCVVYLKKDEQWKAYKNLDILIFEELFVAYKDLPSGAEPTEESKVKRYINLADKFKETYFSR